MTRQRDVIEVVTCDLCGKERPNATNVVLSRGRKRWELDLCDKDYAAVGATFSDWIATATKVKARRR